jgi:hypothetical protein
LWRVAGAAWLVLAASAPAGAAPLTFNTALPVAEGEYGFRQQFRALRSGDDPGPMNREMQARAAVSVLGRGINSGLAVFGALPYVDKTLELTATGSRIKRDNRGLADAAGFARYTLHRADARGRTFRLAAFGGLTAPTGNDDEADGLGRLPPALQNGTGAWDGFAGAVATWQTLNYQFDGQFSYRENREANGFEVGDQTRLDLSWQQRLWPRHLSGGVPGFLYGVLEMNLLHEEKNRLDGRANADSGGDTVWLSPGLQYVTKRWVVEAVVQKPVVQNLNGAALENDWIFTTGFRVKF